MIAKPYAIMGGIALALVLALLLALWRVDNVQGKLALETSSHDQTRTALSDAIAKGNGWKLACNAAIRAAGAQKDALQACLDREAAAQLAGEEREAILKNAQPRPRTKTEETQVVDHETRKHSANRINRPL